MNIFVAGVHGVGKTYLASRLPETCGLVHTSASTLIKEQLALPEWNADKRVADVDENQVALAHAVARHNANNRALLLDGHFVLLDRDGGFVSLGVDVFRALNLRGVVLVEALPSVIAARVIQRDKFYRDQQWLADFMHRERVQAELICKDLGLSLTVLCSPSDAEFSSAVSAFIT